MSFGKKKEFGMEASRKNFKGEYIYELVGFVLIDSLCDIQNSQLQSLILTKDGPWSLVCFLSQSNSSTTIASNIMLK